MRERIKKAIDKCCIAAAALVAVMFAYTAFAGGGASPALSTPGGEGALVIAVDAGHGGFDGGASGADSGIHESGINLSVAKLLKQELEKQGATVIMTRETEEALGSDKNSDMRKRREIINQPGIDIVVSVHMNKFSDRSIYGPMAFYMKGSTEGQLLAEFVIFEVCDAIGHPQRFANPGDYFMIRECKAPAVLIECGFLSNSSDEAKLQDPGHQLKLAQGVAKGIMGYLNDKKHVD